MYILSSILEGLTALGKNLFYDAAGARKFLS